MNNFLLAQIIQGEAGGMGAIGMVSVALSLSCRINQHGHSEARIAREWYGRAEPGRMALELAQLVIENRLPENDYYFCMGHGVDVEAQGMKRGDWVIMNHDDDLGLHLYSCTNVPWRRDDESE